MVILLCKESTMPELTYELNVGITGRTPMNILFKIKENFPHIVIWDPIDDLCNAESCDVYKDGKPLFFDADHLSGYGNEVLKSSFSNMIFQNFNTSEYAENSMVGN